MKNYLYSDLVLEAASIPSPTQKNCTELTEEQTDIARIARLDIDSPALAKKYGRNMGRYVTVFCAKLWLMEEDELSRLSKIVSAEISAIIEYLTQKRITEELCALVVGLGNEGITPDAVGPRTLSNLKPTRHLSKSEASLLGGRCTCKICSVLPGVCAQRGIEAQELIAPLVATLSPDVVIAVDALASRSCERLAATIQISSDGISPGAGIGNHRKELTHATLGVPVIALGVPTVVDSSTLVYDFFQRAGIEDIPAELEAELERGRGFFVSPKECDVISERVGRLLGASLQMALTPK